MKVLHLIPRLDYHGAARQLLLLSGGLPRPQFEPLVCVLGGEGPLTPSFRAAGVDVEVLGWRRWFDVSPFVRLRQVLERFQPDVVHVWQRTALRLLRLVGHRWKGPTVYSEPLLAAPFGEMLDRGLLRRVDRVIVPSGAEADRCRGLGVAASRLVRVPPAVAPVDESLASIAPENLGLPAGKQFLACMGAFERPKGFRDAIWAFDILRFLYPDLRLLLIGDGPDRSRLEWFADSVRCRASVHMVGYRADGPALLARAAVVWVPDHVAGGTNVALEAMARGRPIVASRLANLAEIVDDGRTGFLVAPGSQAEMARRTRPLLDDADLGRRIGEAGRQRAREHFAPSELVRRMALLYEEVSNK